MTREPQVPRPSPRALGALLAALEEQASRREDVRSALAEVQAWLARVLASGDASVLDDKVLVPAGARLTSSLARAAQAEDGRAVRDADLSRVARRSRWKSDAVLFVVERRRAQDEAGAGAALPEAARLELRAREASLRERAAEIGECSTWWLDTSRPLPSDAALHEIASCYALLSRAAEVVHELEESGALEPAPPSDLLYVLAEIQSALLTSLGPVEHRHDDDQRDLFGWLKAQTTRHRIYVDRHMRLDDPAELGRSDERAARLEELREALLAHHRRRRGRQRLLRKVRYHLQKAAESGAEGARDLPTIESAAREWCELGLHPGDPSLKELVAEYVRRHADGVSPGPFVTRVLEAAAPAPQAPSAPRLDALEVLPPMLAGRTALVLAEDDATFDEEELRRALGLAGLDRVVLPDGPDVERVIAAEIATRRPGLVLLGRRLDPEAYAEFKRLCLEAELPFVRLIQGYEAPRVAQQILRQIGWRLRASVAEQRT